MMNPIRVRDLKLANIGERYWDANLSSITDTQLYETVGAYCSGLSEAAKHGYGLFIQGINSIGKTYAMVVILKTAIALGHSTFFVTPSLIKGILAGDDSVTTLETLTTVNILGIDDLGKEQYLDEAKKSSRFFETGLEELLRQRIQHNRPVIITSNRTLLELGPMYGTSMIHLLGEVVTVVPCTGNHNHRADQQKLCKNWLRERCDAFKK